MDHKEWKILCIIPARSGSKGVKDKNIKLLDGLPLLVHSIKQAQSSKYYQFMRIIVSSDSDEYCQIARSYGAETPFLRPKEISGDYSSDFECINHCVEWLKTNNSYYPDLVLQLRPTQPMRTSELIDSCLDKFLVNYELYDSLRTVIKMDKSPFKMYTIENDHLIPLFTEVNGLKEPYNQARQLLPECYLHNGYVDILKISLLETGSVSGTKIFPYVMDINPEENVDIDTVKDFDLAKSKF